jgi:hypothetical protein
MSLLNLKSVFQGELKQRTEDYISNRVDNVGDTKLDYNENLFIIQIFLLMRCSFG